MKLILAIVIGRQIPRQIDVTFAQSNRYHLRVAGSTSAGATVIVTEVNTPEAIGLRVDCRFQRSLVNSRRSVICGEYL